MFLPSSWRYQVSYTSWRSVEAFSTSSLQSFWNTYCCIIFAALKSSCLADTQQQVPLTTEGDSLQVPCTYMPRSYTVTWPVCEWKFKTGVIWSHFNNNLFDITFTHVYIKRWNLTIHWACTFFKFWVYGWPFWWLHNLECHTYNVTL